MPENDAPHRRLAAAEGTAPPSRDMKVLVDDAQRLLATCTDDKIVESLEREIGRRETLALESVRIIETKASWLLPAVGLSLTIVTAVGIQLLPRLLASDVEVAFRIVTGLLSLSALVLALGTGVFALVATSKEGFATVSVTSTLERASENNHRLFLKSVVSARLLLHAEATRIAKVKGALLRSAQNLFLGFVISVALLAVSATVTQWRLECLVHRPVPTSP